MAELSLLVKLVGNSASLDKATASGTKGLAAVGGAIGTADDAVKNFAGGVGVAGRRAGGAGRHRGGKGAGGIRADGPAAADQTASSPSVCIGCVFFADLWGIVRLELATQLGSGAKFLLR